MNHLLPVASVVVDPALQMRAGGLSPEWVHELFQLLRSGRQFDHPHVVFELADGRMLLAGGFHRHEARLVHGEERAEYEVRPGTRADALRYALGDNAGHGLRRTDADKRRAVTSALDDPELRELSDREIDRLCRVSDGFTSRVRKELSGAKPDAKKSAAAAKRNASTPKVAPLDRKVASKPAGEPKPGELFPDPPADAREVPTHVREAVASRPRWDALLRTLRAALDEFDALATGPAADWMRGAANDAGEPWVKAVPMRRGETTVSVWTVPALLAAVQLVRHARPDRVCAGCHGAGCGCCKGRGFLPHSDAMLPGGGDTLDLFGSEADPWE